MEHVFSKYLYKNPINIYFKHQHASKHMLLCTKRHNINVSEIDLCEYKLAKFKIFYIFNNKLENFRQIIIDNKFFHIENF